MNAHISLSGPQRPEGSPEIDETKNNTLTKRVKALEEKIVHLEQRLQEEEDARKMQAMVAHLGLVVLWSEGPIFLPPSEKMPSCMICNETIKAGEWLYFMSARSVIDMSPLIEDQDGADEVPWYERTKWFYLHRDCFLESIKDMDIDPGLCPILTRMNDPRYEKPFEFKD